jgi:hypothetical protein
LNNETEPMTTEPNDLLSQSMYIPNDHRRIETMPEFSLGFDDDNELLKRKRELQEQEHKIQMLQNKKKIAELERSFASEYEPFDKNLKL